MRARVRTLWAVRAGNDPGEYEDAFFPGQDAHIEIDDPEGELRTAVADGAGSGFLSREWAQALTAAFGKTKVSSIDMVLGIALKEWARLYTQYRDEALASAANEVERYYTEQKLARGAAATFAMFQAVESAHGDGGFWRAEVLGDCCLFYETPTLAGARNWSSFPFTRTAELDQAPDLVSTQAGADNTDALHAVKQISHEWNPRSQIFLATDEMARWVLRTAESGGDPWPTLCQLSEVSPDEFASWAASQRANADLKNDDLTLQSVTFQG